MAMPYTLRVQRGAGTQTSFVSIKHVDIYIYIYIYLFYEKRSSVPSRRNTL